MAEYGWGLSEELVKKACTELNEIPEQRWEANMAVREQMVTRPDIIRPVLRNCPFCQQKAVSQDRWSLITDFLRQDDAFILRFLRARKFDTLEAFKLYASYFVYRQNNPHLFKDFQASESAIKEALYDGIPGVLEKCDHFGRRIIVLYSANWDNCRYGLSAIYRAILLTLEKLIDNEECQINGFVIIVDWSQFTFKQSTWLNPKVLKLMIEGLQDCFPARFGAIHFVNQPWYIEAVFKMIKPFLKEKNRNKIHFHGINLGTLHNFIHKEVLPAELGGTEPPYNNQYWAKELIGDESFSFSDKHIYWPDNCMTKTSGHTTLKFWGQGQTVSLARRNLGATLMWYKAMDIGYFVPCLASSASLNCIKLHHSGARGVLDSEVAESDPNVNVIRTRSESFPLDHFTAVEEHASVDEIGTYLDEEFFLID